MKTKTKRNLWIAIFWTAMAVFLTLALTCNSAHCVPGPMSPGLMDVFGQVCQAKITHGTVDFQAEGAKIDCWGTQGQMVYHIRCLWSLKKGGRPVYIWMRHKGIII